MRLITFQKTVDAAEQVGILLEGEKILPIEETGVKAASMNDLIVNGTEADMETLRNAAADPAAYAEKLLDQKDTIELAPIPRPLQDVVCLGLNYTEHAAEAALYSTEAFTQVPKAIFFSKRVSYCQGSHAPIPAHADLTQKMDYESELGVILGKDALNVKAEDAAEYIFGYTIVNDVSARDLQTGHKQWYFGKSLDGFTPMGPCITTADEVEYPPKLQISSVYNGKLMQNSTTDMLIHSIGEILETLTQGMTLKAGTIIATGTPKGVLMGLENPVFMKAGDEIICRIEKIGDLINVVE